jgi:hypothetical protein
MDQHKEEENQEDVEMTGKEQDELDREWRLKMIRMKMASWEGQRFCQGMIMEILEKTEIIVERATVPTCEPDEIDRNTAKRDLLAERAAQPVQLNTTSNRPSKGPLVTLGHSNESPCTTLVSNKGGYGGQDEHPWLKRVPEGVDENGGDLDIGGPCHLYGGGRPSRK